MSDADNTEDIEKGTEEKEWIDFSSSIVSRRLKSFPDSETLEVIVGSEERLYRHHAFVLASYSGYVDTLLSTPLKSKEQTTKHISFPEIEPIIWEKMLGFLEPGATSRRGCPDLEDMLQLLPLYDKYEFHDGVMMMDNLLLNTLKNRQSHYGFVGTGSQDELVPLCRLSFDLQLPKSKNAAIKYAEEQLCSWSHDLTEDHIRILLPMVENNDNVLSWLVMTVLGRKAKSMSREQLRNKTREESFPSEIVEFSELINEHNELTKNISVNYLSCSEPSETADGIRISGNYKNEGHSNTYLRSEGGDWKDPGAMQQTWKRERSYNSEDAIVILEAVDVFGRVWEVATIVPHGEEEEDGNVQKYHRSVIYRWDKGFSSPVPPKSGWESIDGRSEPPKFSHCLNKKHSY